MKTFTREEVQQIEIEKRGLRRDLQYWKERFSKEKDPRASWIVRLIERVENHWFFEFYIDYYVRANLDKWRKQNRWRQE